MEEVWKKIQGYPDYEVSTLGRIRSLKNKKGIILKPRVHTKGYLRVCLLKNGKGKDFYIHRLVGEHFLPRVEGKNEINHINGQKMSNILSNLEWSDRSSNERHKIYTLGHGNNKKVRCVETGKVYSSIREASRDVGIDSSCIGHSLSGRTKTAGNLHWEYIDK